ncbi:hypothetical protein RND81_14G165000 [Saponaria officinalis]|uniref:Uncharacterized protein n=1 Tax=Saponaria officinalis TaxID=3572 RepID=A0AAW1GX24_SAPOF
MESKSEDIELLQSIKPPKLEDAGLEDCALSVHSIHQAFLIAASSRAAADDDDGCVVDPSAKGGALATEDLVAEKENEGVGKAVDAVVVGGKAGELSGDSVDRVSDLKV